MTNLTSVSTFGWYTEGSSDSDLVAISTFGWWLGEVIVIDNPDIYCTQLYIHTIQAIEICL